jgi:hypothetical protein
MVEHINGLQGTDAINAAAAAASGHPTMRKALTPAVRTAAKKAVISSSRSAPEASDPPTTRKRDVIIYSGADQKFFIDVTKDADLGDDEEIIKIEIHNKREFLDALSNLPEDTDDVVIFVHGEPDSFSVGGERIDSTDLAGVKLSEKVHIDEMALVSCNTAEGWQEGNTIAQKIYSYLKPDTLIASDARIDVWGHGYPSDPRIYESFTLPRGGNWVAVYSVPESNYTLPVTRSLGRKLFLGPGDDPTRLRLYNFKAILSDAEAISGYKDRRQGLILM